MNPRPPHPGHGHLPAGNKGLHRNWRTWVVVGLMLAAMLTYIFTVDESIGPTTGTPAPSSPEAVETK